VGLVFCGIDNPNGGEPLSPDDPGSAGHRLFKLCDMGEEVYRDTFARVNAEDDPPILADDWVIVLGRLAWGRLARAHGLPLVKVPLMTWREGMNRRGVRFGLIPHTSGRCHYYNDPSNRERVKDFIATTVREYSTWQSSRQHD
jgi:hypothetical protein